jgi:hypothetical protein
MARGDVYWRVSDHVVRVVDLLHSLRFGRVLFLEVGVIDRAEIVGFSIDCCRRISDVGK